MLTNYLKIAWRTLLKQKVFAVVNIVGMSTAICAALLLSLTAYRQWTYDNFHQNGKDIYQVYREDHTAKGMKTSTSMAAPLMDVLRKEVAGVKRTSRIGGGNMPVRYGNNHYYFDVEMVDADFLQMFTFPLLEGSSTDALQQLNQLVITKKAASALFKNEEAIGKTIEVNIEKTWRPFIVSAVADDLPDNSSITFDMLSRFENVPDYQEVRNTWDVANYPLFAQLEPAVAAASFEKSTPSVVHKYYAEKIESIRKEGSAPGKEGELLLLKTIPLKDFHLNPQSSFYSGMNRFYPWLMVILAVMVISIACINFINLSIARAFTRGSEIGLRKALGAMDKQLLVQFWAEAFLLCFIALLLSLVMTVLLLPYYNTAFGHNLKLGLFANGWLLLGTAAAFFVVTLLAGGYPAWKVARFNIVQVLKGRVSMARGSTLRNGLIVVQFIVAVLLISCTTIIWQQLDFIRATPLGYNTTQVISIPVDNAPPAALTALRNHLAQSPEVQSVTAGMLNLGLGKDGSSGRWVRGFSYKGRDVSAQCIEVDYDYSQTLDLKMMAGRDFSRGFGADTTAVVINEQMAKQLGEKEPLGAILNISDAPMHVIGVVQDYHYESLHKKIEPLMMIMNDPSGLGYIFVKVQSHNPVGTLKNIQGIWKEINPLVEHEASFLDENANRLYKGEERFSRIFMSGAVLAVIISCMGLFAIAVMVMAQRRKEIGIRKVLGASVSGIVLLLSKDFLKLVLVAVVIASPVAWYLMQQWLQGFEFHVHIHWWVFAVTGVLATGIAFITVSMQSVKAAMTNPVKSLSRD
ncbi:FtsX-like permease family protein [Chitinophaga sp. MM2321]|uniref:ABC transporter permease n=1 Tax=Chitinophaga sp. MM2321 TaxID=3137178 RepID=UPI0032D57CD1